MSETIINLVSDTVTKPTKAMLEYMSGAEVGDDVFGEDPTVNALQSRLASMFGKEAALFCPSGTMTNQIAIKVHTKPLDEVVCDHYSHVYLYEAGGYAFHSGVAIQPLIGNYGKITADMVKKAVKPLQDWLPRTKLVVLENTTNKGGGNYYLTEELTAISEVCIANDLKLHLDGARLFNAIAETQQPTAEIGNLFDSISICLSKGLGAPVGSVLIGDNSFISEAKRMRKVMGGGMRQAGYLAAAGLFALDHHIDQLRKDNENAKKIGEILSKSVKVANVLPVKTNIVIFELNHDCLVEDYLRWLKNNLIHATAFGENTVRFVFHRDISDEMVMRLEKILVTI